MEASVKYRDSLNNLGGLDSIQKEWAVQDKREQLLANIKANEREIQKLKRNISIMEHSINLDFVRLAETEEEIKNLEKGLEYFNKYLEKYF